MNKTEFLEKVSKIDRTGEDEFRGMYNSPELIWEQLIQPHIIAKQVTKRDFFAAEAMKAEIITWNSEMSDEHRAALLEDMIERNGDLTINEQMAKDSFSLADIMLKYSNNS